MEITLPRSIPTTRSHLTRQFTIHRAIALLLEMAQNDKRVLGDPPPAVAFNKFGDSSLNLSLRFFIDAFAERVPVTTDMHRNIHRRFAEEGIVMAFPQMDVHFHAAQAAAADL